jgi:hypothetical protein
MNHELPTIHAMCVKLEKKDALSESGDFGSVVRTNEGGY